MGRIPSVHPIGCWARLVLAKALRGLGSFEVPETKTRRFGRGGRPRGAGRACRASWGTGTTLPRLVHDELYHANLANLGAGVGHVPAARRPFRVGPAAARGAK